MPWHLQVQLRFGSVPDWANARIQDANEEQLLDWTGRILTAALRAGAVLQRRRGH